MIVAVRPQAGVMTLRCPRCEAFNEAFGGPADGEKAQGTLFVPVSLETKAAVEAGFSASQTVFCHEARHEVTVNLTL